LSAPIPIRDIEVSDQALFSKDGTVARVIARIDARRRRPGLTLQDRGDMIAPSVLHVAPKPREGTVQQARAWVGDGRRARLALEAERAGKKRTTLVTELERLAG
jgi:hypothetical protein